MNAFDLLSVVVIYGFMLSIVFTVLLFVQHLLGFEHSLRNEKGEVKVGGKIDPLGLLMALLLFAVFIVVAILANRAVRQEAGTAVSFWTYFLVSYGTFVFLNLWDLLILDYMLIIRIRPGWLNLPDTAYFTTMKPHVQGFFRGLGIGVVLSLIPAAISWSFQ